jgi:phage terminase small subunit
MKLSKDIISNRYKDYDQRIIDFLNNIYEDVRENNSKINNYFFVTFDLLANQLLLYFRALDAINNDAALSTEDSYKRQAKSPNIAILNHAHQEIMKILDDYGLSPFASAKIKRLNNVDDSESAQELLENLIK